MYTMFNLKKIINKQHKFKAAKASRGNRLSEISESKIAVTEIIEKSLYQVGI